MDQRERFYLRTPYLNGQHYWFIFRMRPLQFMFLKLSRTHRFNIKIFNQKSVCVGGCADVWRRDLRFLIFTVCLAFHRRTCFNYFFFNQKAKRIGSKNSPRSNVALIRIKNRNCRSKKKPRKLLIRCKSSESGALSKR